MGEIIGAIVGAILGGLFTWFLTRKQQNYIICDEEYRARFALGMPEARILYKDVPVEELGILTLKFRNTGSQVIENPKMTVRLNEGVQVIEAFPSISPERGFIGFEEQQESESEEDACQRYSPVEISLKNDLVQVSVDRFNPYNLNQETITVDMLAEEAIKTVDVLGSGTLSDGTGWSVRFQPRKELVERRVRRVNLVNRVVLLLWFFFSIIYSVWRPPLGILSVNRSTAIQWLSDPLLWILAAWVLLWIIWAFYWGLRGFYLSLPIPLFKRRVQVSFEKW